jgi:hypothetical protein
MLARDKELFIKAMALLGLLLGFYSLYEIVISGNASTCLGTMGIRNTWASAQFLLLPFCVYSIKKWPAIGIISSIVITISLLLLFNRASILALAVSSLVAAFYLKKSWRYFILAGLIVVAVVCILNPKFLDSQSLQNRFATWKATNELVRENPFFGIGINNWALEIPRYAHLMLESNLNNELIYQRPHNDFLWVLSEAGIFGFICYAGIFVFGLFYAIKTRNVLALAGIAGYLVIASLSFPKERAFHSMLLVAYLAFAVRDCRYVRIRLPVRIALFAILGLAIAEFGLCHNSEIHIRKMAMAHDMKNWPEVLAESKKISPVRTMDLFTRPVSWYTAQAHYGLGDNKQTILDNFRAFKHSPNNIFVLHRMGEMFEGLGDLKAADVFYTRALNIQPEFEFAKRNLENLRGRL